jgi:glucose-6-phosphate 1-dehydrogenase
MKYPSVQPTILVVFGITGRLATEQLLPALCAMEKRGLLPEKFYVFGTSRRDINIRDIARSLSPSLAAGDKQAAKRLLARLKPLMLNATEPSDYPRLRAVLESHQQTEGVSCNLLFHLALPADAIPAAAEQLVASKVAKALTNGSTARIIVEKPYGASSSAAKHLVKILQRGFKDHNVYWVGHHSDNQIVDQIYTLRRNNPLLGSAWSARHIKAVDIVSLSDLPAASPAIDCQSAGVLNEVIGSSLLQLLTLTTMSLPRHLDESNLRKARLELLKGIKPLKRRAARGAIRAQYRSYRRDSGAKKSITETFASVPITIDQSGWRHARVRLTAGWALDKTEVRITIVFSDFAREEKQNVLALHIRPEAGITLTLSAQKPGAETPETIRLHESFAAPATLGAYGSQLLEAMSGVRRICPTSDEVLAYWHIIGPLAKRWAKNASGLIPYRVGGRPADIAAK